jgi:aspartyl-tRNA(Asn)/glutamyl-tRNA(Gln) amidotransferase subunit C
LIAMLDKKELEHLGDLARIEIPAKDEKKLIRDLGEILNYFDELKKAPIGDVTQATGSTSGVNVWREDIEENRIPNERALPEFPEKSKGFLKVPPVFEE